MVVLLVGLLLAFGTSEDPFARVPPVIWSAPDELHETWREVRRMKEGGVARVREVALRHLERTTCPGLLDLRALSAVRDAGFHWQDDVALREWARPALARVLVEAHRLWRERWPRHALGIGDVAQAGCGQIDPGTLTRWVRGSEALALMAAAPLVAGVPTAHGIDAGSSSVLIERRVVGRDPDAAEPTLFIHLRRYRAAHQGDPDGLEAKVRAITEGGELAIEMSGPGPDGTTEWRQHWVDPRRHRQVIVIVTAQGPFRLAHARDVRLSPWAPARPGEARGERRWTRDGDGWRAWALIEEGAHVTHMAGLDADISYPMTRGRRFALDPEGIDVVAAWDWFEILHDTALRLGTPVDRFVVGGRVLPRLLALPGARKSALVAKKLFKIVPNHNDHQHIRLARPSGDADTAAFTSFTAL